MPRFIRYNGTIIKMVSALSILSVSIAFSTIPTPSAPITKSNTVVISNNYFNPLNDTFDIYKYKLFEIKNNRLSPFSSMVNHFRNLFYPYERKIPLYYYVHTNST